MKIYFRSIEMLMYGVNGQIDRNDIRLYQNFFVNKIMFNTRYSKEEREKKKMFTLIYL